MPGLGRKIINVKRHSEIETDNMFVEERLVLGISNSPNRCHVQFSGPASCYFIEQPMGVA